MLKGSFVNIVKLSIVKLLIGAILAILFLLSSTLLSKTLPYSATLQVPVGISGSKIFTTPNSTILGLLTVESLVDKKLSCKLRIYTQNCTLLTRSNTSFVLSIRHDLRAFNIKLHISNNTCKVRALIICNDTEFIIEKTIIPKTFWNVTFDFIIPSDSSCRIDPKYEKYVIVVRPSYTPSFLRLIIGHYEDVHPGLITLACVKVYGPEYYSVVLIFKSLSGELLPISSSLEFSQSLSEENYGIITLSGVRGDVVFPLFTPKNPETLIGNHIVEIYLYSYGSSRPILHRTYHIRIISIKGEAIYLTFFASLIALPSFLFTVIRYLKSSQFRDVILCALLGCLIFVIVTIPGHVLWGIGAILGPFDWLIHGLAFDITLYMLYSIAVTLRPKFGTLTMVMFIKWIMYSLFFGRLSIISILWLATSALFFEPSLYLVGITRGKITLSRILLGFTFACLIDKYVDLMLYMSLYRLYYADWYIATYVIGNTLYTIPGIILGYFLSNYLRGVIHE